MLYTDKSHVHIIDFANHAAQIRLSFAAFWDETRVLDDADDVDVDAELADVLTGHTILCDFFPELWEHHHKVHVRELVDRIIPLERDSFHQVLDALRLCCSGLSKLESSGNEEAVAGRVSIGYAVVFASCAVLVCMRLMMVLTLLVYCNSYNLVARLKKQVESESRFSESSSSSINMDEIKSKMLSRVSKYRKVFSGKLNPCSVLVSVRFCLFLASHRFLLYLISIYSHSFMTIEIARERTC